MPRTLTKKALNRAFLSRQLLLKRNAGTPLEVVEQLVGLQAQAPAAPYVGLWSRIARFDPESLSTLLLDRAAVRLILMRSTVHLVSSADCRWLRPTVEPCLDRTVGPAVWRRLDGVDREELAEYARKLLDQEPRDAREFGKLLRERWPDADLVLLGRAVRAVVPVVQIPPRGLWGRPGQPVYATAETWLGGALDPRPALDRLVRRYLAAFGPATVRDIQTWSGLTRLREVVDEAADLVRYTGPDGEELWDVPEGAHPDPRTPAPVRYLAEFDNAVLGHHDRSRIVDPAYQRLLVVRNAVVPGTVLVNGFVRGTWRVRRDRGQALLEVDLFDRVSPRQRADLEAEGARLLAFLAPGVAASEVRVCAAP
jgi:hypothetical protein